MEDIIVVIGTEIKLLMTISGLVDVSGLEESLTSCKVSVKAFTNAKNKVDLIAEEIIINADENNCLLLIDTAKLEPGRLSLDITLNIPDEDFDYEGNDSYRKEIYRKQTNIKLIK